MEDLVANLKRKDGKTWPTTSYVAAQIAIIWHLATSYLVTLLQNNKQNRTHPPKSRGRII
jgi:hypothetical protein